MTRTTTLTAAAAALIALTGAATAQNADPEIVDPVAEARDMTGMETTGETELVTDEEYLIGGGSSATVDAEVLEQTTFDADSPEKPSDAQKP